MKKLILAALLAVSTSANAWTFESITDDAVNMFDETTTEIKNYFKPEPTYCEKLERKIEIDQIAWAPETQTEEETWNKIDKIKRNLNRSNTFCSFTDRMGMTLN